MGQIPIFISYAHDNEQLLNALKTHLTEIRQQGFIEIWSHRNIQAGDRWADA